MGRNQVYFLSGSDQQFERAVSQSLHFMYDAFPVERDEEYVWQLFHENVGHLHSTHDRMIVLSLQHGGYVAVKQVIDHVHVHEIEKAATIVRV